MGEERGIFSSGERGKKKKKENIKQPASCKTSTFRTKNELFMRVEGFSCLNIRRNERVGASIPCVQPLGANQLSELPFKRIRVVPGQPLFIVRTVFSRIIGRHRPCCFSRISSGNSPTDNVTLNNLIFRSRQKTIPFVKYFGRQNCPNLCQHFCSNNLNLKRNWYDYFDRLANQREDS